MSGTNGLGAPQMPPGPAAQNPHADAFGQAQASYAATSKAMGMMDKVRTELTGLAKMGSAVTPEDVIQGAGKLVGSGADPMELAGLMSDMPTNGGDALAAWVAQHAATSAQNEAKLKMAHEAAKHSLGVASIHHLAHASMQPVGQGPAMQPQAQGLAMMPSKGAV